MYEKQTWEEFEAEYPNRYTKSNEDETRVDLIRSPGVVSAGTPVSAARLNHMEDGIDEAHTEIESVLELALRLPAEAAFSPGSYHYIAGTKKSSVGFDKDSPGSYFPAICLDTIETSLDIDAAHWPLLVPVLRAAKMIYLEGLTGESADYELTGWAVAGGTATLTLANNAANNQLLAVIAEHFLAIADYPVVYLPNAISAIDAGDYRITGAYPVTRTIEFATSAGNGSGASSERVQIFPHRIPGSATQARIYGARGMALMSAGWDGHMAGGLRRSYMQGHLRELRVTVGGGDGSAYSWDQANRESVPFRGTAVQSQYKDKTNTEGAPLLGAFTSDGTNGTPRIGAETEPRSLTAHLYLGGGRYVP